MIVTVLERAVSRRFVEPSYVRMMLDLSTSDMSDTKLNTMIDDVSAYIERYCDRPNEMFAERVSETIRMSGSRGAIYLSRWPIINVESVTENGSALGSDYFEVAYGDDHDAAKLIRLDGAGGQIWWGWPMTGLLWPAYTTTVIYRAGYYADDDTGGSVPHDLRVAALRMIDRARLSVGRDSSVRSEEVPGVARITYGSSASESSAASSSGGFDMAESLLAPYRRGPGLA